MATKKKRQPAGRRAAAKRGAAIGPRIFPAGHVVPGYPGYPFHSYLNIVPGCIEDNNDIKICYDTVITDVVATGCEHLTVVVIAGHIWERLRNAERLYRDAQKRLQDAEREARARRPPGTVDPNLRRDVSAKKAAVEKYEAVFRKHQRVKLSLHVRHSDLCYCSNVGFFVPENDYICIRTTGSGRGAEVTLIGYEPDEVWLSPGVTFNPRTLPITTVGGKPTIASPIEVRYVFCLSKPEIHFWTNDPNRARPNDLIPDEFVASFRITPRSSAAGQHLVTVESLNAEIDPLKQHQNLDLVARVTEHGELIGEGAFKFT